MKRKNLFLCLVAALSFLPAISFAQSTAKPVSGDGITTFLQRYGLNTRENIKEFKRINKGKFTSDGGLILGRSYKLPAKGNSSTRSASAKEITEPLFGKKYKEVKCTSNTLKGACFYLVSGHGGPDPGAIGKVGRHELHEDEYAYDIILRLARNLMEKGAKVHIIIQDEKDGIRDDRYLDNSKRETCMGEAIPLDQVARLQQRCDAVNRLYRKDRGSYKRAVFIHVDSRSRKDRVDVFFYHAEGSKNGERLANNIRNTFEKKYDKHQPNRGFDGSVSSRDLFVLTKTYPAAVFLELGNIQNANDQKRLVLPSNRQALADWICDGIVTDYKKQK